VSAHATTQLPITITVTAPNTPPSTSISCPQTGFTGPVATKTVICNIAVSPGSWFITNPPGSASPSIIVSGADAASFAWSTTGCSFMTNGGCIVAAATLNYNPGPPATTHAYNFTLTSTP